MVAHGTTVGPLLFEAIPLRMQNASSLYLENYNIIDLVVGYMADHRSTPYLATQHAAVRFSAISRKTINITDLVSVYGWPMGSSKHPHILAISLRIRSTFFIISRIT
ncbi:hypothetical protein AVEN_185833-1 [Araneus ventricosus]|uniref:Uncharacterized protein n=1 Tax=Araneus ventricosus TaxID=182803 RepID=A0A4Y2WUJ2_ARAVE|nr:hypothetical protein AVEN_185833-1 [Araneus ventricosus]